MWRSNNQRITFEKEALPHMDALYSMALRLTHNENNAEDLVQDAMVKAFRFFHQFEKGTNIKAWLFKVMINLFYNNCRKNKNIARLQAEAQVDFHHDRFVSEASMATQNPDVLLEGLATEDVCRAVEKLPEDYSTAVLLCDLHEFSYRDISDIMGCPVGTVMSRLYRGRKMLQKTLYGYAVEQGIISPESPDEQEDVADLAAYRQRTGGQ